MRNVTRDECKLSIERIMAGLELEQQECQELLVANSNIIAAISVDQKLEPELREYERRGQALAKRVMEIGDLLICWQWRLQMLESETPGW